MLQTGREIYNYRCYFCHGYNGDAKTQAAQFLQPAPIAFTAQSPEQFTLKRIAAAVRDGRSGTAMKSFQRQLNAQEIRAVAYFVFQQFVVHKKNNTQYHSAANGWQNHQRYSVAFPFVRGELSIDDVERFNETQREGLQLFLRACISCHEQAGSGAQFKKRPLSYPRNNYDFKSAADSVSSASIYARHDRSLPRVQGDESLRKGQQLYEANCSFCHGADGSGKNWIGQFIQPVAKNLTDQHFLSKISKNELQLRIAQGVEGTAMPAWKHVLNEQEISLIVDYIYKEINKK